MLWAGLCGVEDLQSMADHRLMVIDVRHHDDHHSRIQQATIGSGLLPWSFSHFLF